MRCSLMTRVCFSRGLSEVDISVDFHTILLSFGSVFFVTSHWKNFVAILWIKLQRKVNTTQIGVTTSGI
jgi:hypothetical protein